MLGLSLQNRILANRQKKPPNTGMKPTALRTGWRGALCQLVVAVNVGYLASVRAAAYPQAVRRLFAFASLRR